jgi:hypothetical protein
MRLRWGILFCILCAACSKPSIKKSGDKPQTLPFFYSVPVEQFSSSGAPRFNLQIEDQVFSIDLDLGSSGNLSLDSDKIQSIKNKMFKRVGKSHGIRGKEYYYNSYEVPEIKIGDAELLSIILDEENKDLLDNALLLANPNIIPDHGEGRIGWPTFYHSNLLLDIPHMEIGFCSSLDNLRNHGYDPDAFTAVPITLDRDMIEFDLQTEKGTLRCVLDSGATRNLFHSPLTETQSLEERLKDASSYIQYTTSHIGAYNVGPITFIPVPLLLPHQYQAMLGMEFIHKHIIFINFAEKMIYFSKPSGKNLSCNDGHNSL